MDKEVLRLKKRFLKDQAASSAFFMRRAVREKQMREVRYIKTVKAVIFALYVHCVQPGFFSLDFFGEGEAFL